MLKSFGVYTLALGCVLVVAGMFVHALMVNLYSANVNERLTVLTQNAEEALENNSPGKPIAVALAAVLDSPDEGVALFDARGKLIASAGMIDPRNARAETLHGDGMHGGWIRATISNDRVTSLLRPLDLGLLIGTIVAMVAGGLIITWISARAMTRVESAYRRIYHFTGDAAHELRTPLSVIAANADDLGFEGADAAGRERRLNNIRDAARQMRGLMEGLLLLARADEGAAQGLHAIDVAACIQNVVQSYQPDATARQLTLTAGVRSNVTIYGQPEQVARIVGNLIENAMQYTPACGSIAVTCMADRGGVTIEVADTGVGIAPEDVERVFDRFWRAKGAQSSDGSGLGLAIVLSLARAHGGDVSVRSRPGEGSTFIVKLPLRPPRTSRLSTVS